MLTCQHCLPFFQHTVGLPDLFLTQVCSSTWMPFDNVKLPCSKLLRALRNHPIVFYVSPYTLASGSMSLHVNVHLHDRICQCPDMKSFTFAPHVGSYQYTVKCQECTDNYQPEEQINTLLYLLLRLPHPGYLTLLLLLSEDSESLEWCDWLTFLIMLQSANNLKVFVLNVSLQQQQQQRIMGAVRKNKKICRPNDWPH